MFCSSWLPSSQPGHNVYLRPALITSSAAAQTLPGTLGHVGDKPTPWRALQRCSGGTGAGWIVSTYMLLHCRSWVDFPRSLDEGGAGENRWQEEEEVLRTGDRAGSCPQKTQAVMPVSRACWRMSYLLFQELTDFNSSFDQGWSVTSSTALAFDSVANSANVCIEQIHCKDTGHTADNAMKRLLQVLEWETIVPSPCI